MRWTPELDKRLQTLHSEFYSDPEIATAMGSTPYAVSTRRRRLGLLNHNNTDGRGTFDPSESQMASMVRVGTAMLIERICEGLRAGTLRVPA